MAREAIIIIIIITDQCAETSITVYKHITINKDVVCMYYRGVCNVVYKQYKNVLYVYLVSYSYMI